MSFNISALDDFPILTTPRLILREYTEADAVHLYEIRTDPEVLTYLDREPAKDIQQAKEFLQTKVKERLERKGISWAITLVENGEFVGDVAFWKLLSNDHRAEVGYTLRKKYWGQGYMTEAFHAMLRWGFDELGLHTAYADINPENDASRKLLLKMGFQKEGYFRENYHFRGDYLDSEMYGLLKMDFTY